MGPFFLSGSDLLWFLVTRWVKKGSFIFVIMISQNQFLQALHWGLYFRNFKILLFMYLILSKHQNYNWIPKFRLQCVSDFPIPIFQSSNEKKTMTSAFAKHPQLLQIDLLSSIIQYTSQSNWSDHLMKNGPLINLCFKRAVKQQGDQFCTSTVQRWSRLSPLLDRTINQTEEARYKWELSKSAKQRWTANI